MLVEAVWQRQRGVGLLLRPTGGLLRKAEDEDSHSPAPVKERAGVG